VLPGGRTLSQSGTRKEEKLFTYNDEFLDEL
jgi:hypothetical protein